MVRVLASGRGRTLLALGSWPDLALCHVVHAGGQETRAAWHKVKLYLHQLTRFRGRCVVVRCGKLTSLTARASARGWFSRPRTTFQSLYQVCKCKCKVAVLIKPL